MSTQSIIRVQFQYGKGCFWASRSQLVKAAAGANVRVVGPVSGWIDRLELAGTEAALVKMLTKVGVPAFYLDTAGVRL